MAAYIFFIFLFSLFFIFLFYKFYKETYKKQSSNFIYDRRIHH